MQRVEIELRIGCECGKENYYDESMDVDDFEGARLWVEWVIHAFDYFKDHGWSRDPVDPEKWYCPEHGKEAVNA